jgi:hypothetical protein
MLAPALIAVGIGALLGMPALAPAPADAASGASIPGVPVESENPINDQGSNYHYRTYITSITPKVPGLSVEVLEFADRLLLRNHTGRTVTVYGYYGEPYARVLPDGTAEENVHAPAVYLNTNFYAEVTVPSFATPTAPVKWVALDRAAQFEWHDHRIHYMSPLTPPQVKNTAKRTWIFDWEVPIRVGTTPGAIRGELYWVPEGSTAPLAAIVALGVAMLAGVAFVLVVRRRRARGDAPQEPHPPGEAW